ncbi:PREDICTED: uncharacterized protein LOC109156314 [Ipomoea nil]|uniref:uncharacterized protein LOC109156314 n=1 Tax=Ipomoea nil TaxID=35883 RepID=UPI0009014559|nr:PREDICTED: uncharacterized protein LOC109156314 [Ipomoea nil]
MTYNALENWGLNTSGHKPTLHWWSGKFWAIMRSTENDYKLIQIWPWKSLVCSGRIPLRHVPQLDNADADILSKLAQEAPEHISKITRILMIPRHSIHRLSVAPIQPAEETWISDLMEYLQHGHLPDDPQRARKEKLRAPRFQVQDDRLYRRSYGGPLQRCLNSFEADLVMNRLHSGICSSHQGGRSLARRIMVIGYY